MSRSIEHIAQGYTSPSGNKKRLVVNFEPATFAELHARAVHKQQSLNHYIRDLIDGALHRLDGK